MALHTTLRRSLAVLAAGGFITLATAFPAAAEFEPGAPPSSSTGSGTVVREIEVVVDDNALEYLQIGLGALGGMALVGAGAAAIGARHHDRTRAPQPA